MKLVAAKPSSATRGGDHASNMTNLFTGAVAEKQRTNTPYKIDVANQDLAKSI